jgi:hypothetical protein
VRQQRALEEASESVGTDALSPDAIPGILLNAAIVNLFSDSEVSEVVFKYVAFFHCGLFS